MTINYPNNINSCSYSNFQAKNLGNNKSAPKDNMQQVIDSKVDTFVEKVDKERKKKSSRTAIAVGSAVVFATAVIALLNPSTSAKTIKKWKAIQAQAKAELESGRLKGLNKFYKQAKVKTTGVLAKLGEIGNNYNNGKDILWENLCCREKKSFAKIKSEPIRKFLQSIDHAITSFMSKINGGITKMFDNISKHTVKRRYSKALEKTSMLDELINKYKNKLPASERSAFEAKLAEVKASKKYLNNDAVIKRLENIENNMKNLREETIEDYKAYGRKLVGEKGVKGSGTPFGKWIKEMHFFSETRLAGKKEVLGNEGKEAIEKLIKEDATQKGGYNEIIEKLKPYLSAEENHALEISLNKTTKSIQKANITECEKYFDKKRDLMLGSAPTDVLTAGVGLALAGISVGRGKDREEKIHRTISVAIPAVAAVGTSLYLTGNLFTGVKNMLLSGGIGIAISKISSLVANAITGKDDEVIEDNVVQKEIKNA